MTSTNIERISVEDESVRYKYVFEVLSNTASKVATFKNFEVGAVVKNEEVLLLKSLLSVLYTFTGKRNVVIGLGPGRCGTMSLAILLSAQRNMLVHHESEPRLSWGASIYEFIGKWASLFYSVIPPLPIVVDIANWYLPFVPYILEVNDKVKFVCMKRDIEEVVASFMLKVPNTSHWTFRGSKYWHENWLRAHNFRKHFPKYDLPKEEGCRKYIEEYYKSLEDYANSMPEKFKIFDTDALNHEDGVKSILEFCGVQEHEMQIECPHINRTSDSHKENLRRFKNAYGENF